MSQTIELNAVVRERGGKGAARAVRRQGLVPGVIYGDKKEPETISIDRRELVRLLNIGNFMTTLVSIDVGGTKTRALARDVQFDPVKDFPLHVDFLRLGTGARIAVDIPVHFLNEEASPASSAAVCSTWSATTSSWSARPTRSRTSSRPTSPATTSATRSTFRRSPCPRA